MGVRSLARQGGAINDLQTLQGPSTSGLALVSKVPEKQPSMRRKGVEKSVLDDIMGDPEDFRDLGDSEAESDGGRWEDTMINEEQGGVDVEEGMQEENLEPKDALEKTLEMPPSKRDPHAFLDARFLPHLLENQGLSGAAVEGISQRHQQVSDKESICVQNGRTSKGSTHKLQQKRYFVIKSLNHENIAKSIERGIWATQAMNEPVLNEAFENSEKVLLIFSVNMSGHFQGYAQMISPIGRRRANVWSEANSGANPWGGTFSVEWIQMYDLSFQKTLHLKNPLNSFKPVKISRDCQELTQDIGDALCALIDEGAEREGKEQRSIGRGDAFLTNKFRIERSCMSNGLSYRPVVGAALLKGPAVSVMYPTTLFPPAMSHEPYNPQMTMISSASTSAMSGLTRQPGRSHTGSPRSVSSGKGTGLKRDRGKDLHETRERVWTGRENSRICSDHRNVGANHEDDLLNMTYEEYLQHHGKQREYKDHHQGSTSLTSQQSTLYGLGWMGNDNLTTSYSDDQYSNYLANWYGNQQGLMMPNGSYYGAQAVANPYPGNQPS